MIFNIFLLAKKWFIDYSAFLQKPEYLKLYQKYTDKIYWEFGYYYFWIPSSWIAFIILFLGKIVYNLCFVFFDQIITPYFNL
jgi:hypothetical protein